MPDTFMLAAVVLLAGLGAHRSLQEGKKIHGALYVIAAILAVGSTLPN